MDTTTATERVVELRKKLATLDTRRHESETALVRERATQAKATTERAKLVEELAGADDATVAWAHNEIDRLDSALRLSSRVSEGLSNSLSRMVSEIAALTVELTEATNIVEQENREQGLRTLKIQLHQTRQAAEAAIGQAREALTALNLAASQGVERYGVAAQGLAATILDEFRHQQINPELTGWRESRPNFGNLQFTLRPMVRG